MSKQEVMWTTAGAAGVISALTAGLTVWLLLTNPGAVTLAAGQASALALLHTVGGAVLHLAAHVLGICDARIPGAAMRRHGSSSFAIGVFILVIGVALFIDRIGLLPWTTKWSVWPLLLIAFGVMHLIDRDLGGVFPAALGAWIWAGQAGAVSLMDTWPLLLVVFGVVLMLETWIEAPRRTATPVERERSPVVALAIIGSIFAATAIDAHNYVVNHQAGRSTHANSVAALGARVERVTPHTPFTGGEVVAIVGLSTLDLRQATVGDGSDVTIDVGVFGGSAMVDVPEGWTVDVRIVPVLGRVLDRRGQPQAVDTHASRRGRQRLPDTWDQLPAPAPAPAAASASHARIVLTGSVVFGSLVIR